MGLYCKKCGHEYREDAKFCSTCGAPIPIDEKIEQEMQSSVVPEKKEEKNNILLILISKLPNEPSLRWRLMAGFFFVAVICLLVGYFVTAVFFAVAGVLLTKKVYNKYSDKKLFLIAGVIICFLIGVVSFISGDENSVNFKEDWYKTYTVFESESGEILEIHYWDIDDYFGGNVNGTYVFSGYGKEYEKDKDGAYVYAADVGGGELRYYPKDDNSIVVVFADEPTRYYPVDASEDERIGTRQKGSYYITDTVYGEDLAVDKLNVT